MACSGITDYMTRETGRFLEGAIYQRVFGKSLWMNITRRGIFPAGLSETINVMTIERTAPYDATPTWTQVSVNDGAEGGACLPAVTDIEPGSTTRSFNLYRRALHGPEFCAEEFRSVFELGDRLNKIADSFANQVRLEWEMQDRNEYFRLCKTKVIVDGCPPSEDTDTTATWTAVATAAGATCPTSILTQGIIDRYRMKLIRDGAVGVATTPSGGVILGLVSSGETLDSLIRDNSDIRQDFRWAKPMELLAAIGVERTYRGFMHMEDLYPNRYECNAGTYTKVATFTQSNATKGKKAEINSSWETATYEESYIHSTSVFEQLVPQPIVNPAPDWRFNAVDYMGNMKVVNIPDKACNPDENIIFHRMIMAAGSKPEYPEHGVAFIHLRCDPACNLVTSCTT